MAMAAIHHSLPARSMRSLTVAKLCESLSHAMSAQRY